MLVFVDRQVANKYAVQLGKYYGKKKGSLAGANLNYPLLFCMQKELHLIQSQTGTIASKFPITLGIFFSLYT